MGPLFNANDLVLFQGDSITDHGRDRSDPACVGTGYAMIASAWFTACHPELGVQFANRGVSGDQTSHLLERWQEDCIDLVPDWISILIGINDSWCTLGDDPRARTIQDFEADYVALLEMTRQQLPGTGIIICEPFLLDIANLDPRFRLAVDPRIHIARRLAREYADVYVPFDGLFQAACMHQAPEFWAEDAVHPSKSGHALMARAWLQAVGEQ